MMPSYKAFALAMLFAVLSGCTSSGPGFVVRDWSTNLRELSVYPIFPPREDVCVGDVFVSPVSVDSSKPLVDPSGHSPIGSFHAHVNMERELKNHYAQRTRFPAQAAADVASSGKSTSNSTNGGCNGGQLSDLLRQVAFPLFVRAQVSSAELGAYVPPDVYTAAVRAGAAFARSASVSVSAGESYGLPVRDALGPFVNSWVMSEATAPSVTKISPSELSWLKLAAAGNSEASKHYVDLTLVTELYVVRTFDITLHASNQTGGAINISTVTTPVTATPVSQDSVTATTSKVSSPSASATSIAQELRDSMQAQWKSVPGQSAPGVTAQVLASTSGDVALRATYERPIAIGYRGIRWRVNLDTGEFSPAPPPGGSAEFNRPSTSAEPGSVMPRPTR